MISFQGKRYYDDRLFVLSLCRGKIKLNPDGTVETTIFHEPKGDDFTWCLATYRNSENYPLATVQHFESKDEAQRYIELVEPTIPLISLNGQAPKSPLSYLDYLAWKQKNTVSEYDYKKVYLPGGANPCEFAVQSKEQYLRAKNKIKEALGVRRTRGNVTCTGASTYEVLGLVSITLPGSWWWHTADLNDPGAVGAIFRCYEKDNQHELGYLLVIDVSGDPDEPNISTREEDDIPELDRFFEREIRKLMVRDGREMVRWMKSQLNRRSQGKSLVTAYIAKDRSRERQYIDFRTRIGQRNVIIGGCFDVGRANDLAKPIYSALSDARLLNGRGTPSQVVRLTYGFKRDDPVLCFMANGEMQYISSLRCPSGHRLLGSRNGSQHGKCTDPKTHRSSSEKDPAQTCLVDRYDLQCEGGEYSCTLYFDMYHPHGARQPAPAGLSRVG